MTLFSATPQGASTILRQLDGRQRRLAAAIHVPEAKADVHSRVENVVAVDVASVVLQVVPYRIKDDAVLRGGHANRPAVEGIRRGGIEQARLDQVIERRRPRLVRLPIALAGQGGHSGSQ